MMQRQEILAAAEAAGAAVPVGDSKSRETLSAFAEQYHERMFPNRRSTFRTTDPDYVRMLDNFAFDEVVRSDNLPGSIRFLAILAALTAMGSIDEFRVILPAAFRFGVKPEEAKEVIYQATAYLGIGRAYPFLVASNEIFNDLNLPLPAADNSPRDDQSRMERGRKLQVEVFGEGMRNFVDNGPEDTRRFRVWLTANCFEDYYARSGLTLAQREMVTFCFLTAQGGCEPQLASHISGNIRLGNDKVFLLDVIAQMLPFIGYPRALNAIAVLEKVCGKGKMTKRQEEDK